VAEEFGMSKEEFLSSCCDHKAGMPPDAWRSAKTCRVHAFRAEVLRED
jgi:AMMECR1 domain-containing protein